MDRLSVSQTFVSSIWRENDCSSNSDDFDGTLFIGDKLRSYQALLGVSLLKWLYKIYRTILFVHSIVYYVICRSCRICMCMGIHLASWNILNKSTKIRLTGFGAVIGTPDTFIITFLDSVSSQMNWCLLCKMFFYVLIV